MSVITREDNMELMARYPDGYFPLAIVDPPYAIDGNSHRNNKSRGRLAHSKGYHMALWDQDIPTKEYFDELMRVSKHQIIFGINYFVSARNLKIGPGRIFWDKCNGTTGYSDGELAYCSMHYSMRMFRYMWNGMMQGSSIENGHIMNGKKDENEIRIHPTHKPVALYKWLLSKYAKPGDLILDTHLGSGSIAIACYDMGYDLTACEIDQQYYDDAIKRISDHKKQLKLF